MALKKLRGLRKSSAEDVEYQPESNSEDDELDQRLIKSFLGKFKKRKLWSSDEKYVTRTYFKDELANDTYIHSDKILKLKSKYNEILKNRSVPMIKQWLEREKNAIKEQADGVNAKRSRYSSMEREILERSTEKHSFDGSEPSLAELEELIEEHDVLKHRSADSLLRKFRYMQRKSKECEEKK
ncbi:uncharacterized protein isoform X3 [Leptinotarsa decemlineata]|uniref:uncharacterized protein isoform X3 n=1 Tax=Leptinotarsa decemlineata TaxID=7539 RepID=UPI003D307C3F